MPVIDAKFRGLISIAFGFLRWESAKCCQECPIPEFFDGHDAPSLSDAGPLDSRRRRTVKASEVAGRATPRSVPTTLCFRELGLPISRSLLGAPRPTGLVFRGSWQSIVSYC
jgi:hypothetical protein